MNTRDLSPWEKEIIRLNKIISVLLEQIDTLKLRCRHLEQQVETNETLHSNTETGVGINKPLHSNIETGVGINKALLPNTETGVGVNKTLHSQSETRVGINEPLYTNSLQGLPVNSLFYPEREQGVPLNEEIYPKGSQQGTSNSPFYPNTEKGLPSNESVYQLPPTIEASQQNIGLLIDKVGAAILRRSGGSAQQGAAKLLIHFYNKGTGKYSELQKLTGYSTGGLAKLMMLVKRKGLIQRSAFQQFVPSKQALQLMQDAKLK